MGLFEHLLRRRYDDPTLGTLVGAWGRWRGQIGLGPGPAMPLVLTGDWAAPHAARLHLARELPTRYPPLVPTIEEALFEHYEPYGEAIAAGDEPPHPRVPVLTQPEQVRPYVIPVRVLIEAVGGVDTVEIAYRAAWDDEHTLGARIQGWRLVGLNGSVRV